MAPAPSGKAEDAISSFSKRRSATTEPAISPQATKPTAMNDFVAASAGAVANDETRGTGMLLRNRTAAPLQSAKAAANLAAKSNPAAVAAAPALPAKISTQSTTTETLPLAARTTVQAANQTVEVSAAPKIPVYSLNEVCRQGACVAQQSTLGCLGLQRPADACSRYSGSTLPQQKRRQALEDRQAAVAGEGDDACAFAADS